MTREEAILCIKGIKNLGHDMFTEQKDFQECIDMAIKVLEQEPCEDAVSRQSVLEELRTCFDTHTIYDENNGKNYIIYEDAVDMMEKLPSVTPTRKKGKWKKESIGFMYDICSECGQRVTTGYFEYNYCPNCGAEMESEKNEHR